MTQHYGDVQKISQLPAQSIVDGWNIHGKKMPVAFAEISFGDAIAFRCWIFLELIKDKKLSIDDFIKEMKFEDESMRPEFKVLLTEVVELV